MATRRNFLTNTAAMSAGFLWNDWASWTEQQADFRLNKALDLKVLATNWGFEGTWDAFCERVKVNGYDGVEVWVPQEEQDRDDFLAATSKHGLSFGFLCGGSDKDYAKHLAQFETALQKATALKPLYINCHSGRDHFTFEQSKAFMTMTTRYHQATKVPIYHETHRGRILFAAHITREFLEKTPDLRLTLDISHWCTVHESLLGDQAETVALALGRTDHIHARIGHAEGPQVNDPRAPEWETTVKQHLSWWDKIAATKAEKGQPLTILTEFGPPNYLPTLPYTQQPVADQWSINTYMKDMLRARYKG